MTEKKFKQVCECKNCGNEAEMQITCTLETEESTATEPVKDQSAEKPLPKKKVQGQAVCSHCGNEADMWIDLEDSQL
jgi:DNA-directed RNA polymerase subunit M/transcription elongation factor TFIIS